MVRKGLAVLFVVTALVVTLISCSKGPKVIPKRQMEKIYRDMFLADQWLEIHSEKRPIADTTWFYAPIFEKYGYDVEDYRASVDFYLSDPKRYAEMIGRVAKGLEDESAAIQRSLRQQDKIRHRADSIARAMKAYKQDDLSYYGDLFYVNSMTDRIDIRKNSKGVYFPFDGSVWQSNPSAELLEVAPVYGVDVGHFHSFLEKSFLQCEDLWLVKMKTGVDEVVSRRKPIIAIPSVNQ